MGLCTCYMTCCGCLSATCLLLLDVLTLKGKKEKPDSEKNIKRGGPDDRVNIEEDEETLINSGCRQEALNGM